MENRQLSDNLIRMTEVSATEAARTLADLLDAVEHRGEHFTVVRRGKPIAKLGPVQSSQGAGAKAVLRTHRRDANWAEDLSAIRALVEIEDRP